MLTKPTLPKMDIGLYIAKVRDRIAKSPRDRSTLVDEAIKHIGARMPASTVRMLFDTPAPLVEEGPQG